MAKTLHFSVFVVFWPRWRLQVGDLGMGEWQWVMCIAFSASFDAEGAKSRYVGGGGQKPSADWYNAGTGAAEIDSLVLMKSFGLQKIAL